MSDSVLDPVVSPIGSDYKVSFVLERTSRDLSRLDENALEAIIENVVFLFARSSGIKFCNLKFLID